MLSDKLYNVLKFVAQYLLPGFATLYFGLAKIWNLPYAEQIVGTILAFDAFLGAVLGISVAQYNKQMTQPVLPGLMEPGERNPLFSMSSSTYDILYWVAQIVLPAIGALYFAMGALWGFPYGEQIVGTISLVDAFLGIFLGISTYQYKQALVE
jgi:hypothetical protein